MTKRDIIKFLERKKQEKIDAVWSEYSKSREQLLQVTYSKLELPDLAGKMQPLLEQAYQLWNSWKTEHENYEGLTFNNSFYSLPDMLNSCTSSESATFKKLVNDHISMNTKELTALRDESHAQTKSVSSTFNTVFATVHQMKTAKQAAEYLKELGFDLSELESPEKQVETALMVPVDTRFLFVKAAG